MSFSLPVTYENRVVASVTNEGGDTALVYDPDWRAAGDAFPVSLAMPLSGEAYGSEILLPWLMNLLPEGEPLRAMTRMLGAAAEDVLALIAATGNDLAGALSIGRKTVPGAPAARTVPDAAALERIIKDLPARPFLADEEGVAMSLAGAQDKLPVLQQGDHLAIPVNGAASTHILKPDNLRLPGSVQNEALCMRLAHHAGLNVAPVITGVAGNRTYLLVTRYDRTLGGEWATRIHQEDFCQVLRRPPAAKYEFNKTGTRGPSLPEMFGVTRDHMTALDTNRLLDAVIFNIAIGNVDSHAKNYSALLSHQGTRLAPLYDLMSGLAWDGITRNHAQAVGGKVRALYIHGRHWARMAEASGLSARATIKRVISLTDKLLQVLPAAVEEVAAMPAGAGAMLDIFHRAIGAQAAEVRAHANDGGGDDEPDAVSVDPKEASDATAYHE